MPSTWRAHVIEERLAHEGLRVDVAECDVYELPPEQRTIVVSHLIAEHTSFPMVLVGDTVVSDDGVDLDAVVRAVRERFAGSSCC